MNYRLRNKWGRYTGISMPPRSDVQTAQGRHTEWLALAAIPY